ncbi:hypothetical protein DYBT9623_05537 [Dyadobacter sp. CECT 9623]|uniref:Uncharacterized protein n=1 Tax=Dyadobacter linearis TaxID=2823330 RepID=A0ABN7RMX3_9BACT|nr:hypothetical protein DYBT9623_05537 [Dyadobacter sp. CECT 9623]
MAIIHLHPVHGRCVTLRTRSRHPLVYFGKYVCFNYLTLGDKAAGELNSQHRISFRKELPIIGKYGLILALGSSEPVNRPAEHHTQPD